MRMTRRSLIPQLAAAAVLSPTARTFAAKNGQNPAQEGLGNVDGVEGITRRYVEFVSSTKFEDLPPKTVRAAKRFVLDSVGCAVAGWRTNKGRVAANVMMSAGGVPNAHILGTDTRVSAANAAFANAELMNGLDYDAIPHTPPVTVPAILALGEKEKASGRSVLLAAVLAHEIASRLSGASSQMSEALRTTGHTPNVFAINSEAIIGAAAAGAALSGQSQMQIASAIGLADHRSCGLLLSAPNGSRLGNRHAEVGREVHTRRNHLSRSRNGGPPESRRVHGQSNRTGRGCRLPGVLRLSQVGAAEGGRGTGKLLANRQR
jgi:hypothetical protein